MSSSSFAEKPDQENLVSSYFSRALKSINETEQPKILELVNFLKGIRSAGGTVFIAGNGGSASTAEHIALDWMLGTGLSSPPLRVLSLADSSASITATGNDVAFDMVFSRQLRSLANKGDLLVVVSASGNSANLVGLVQEAKGMGLQVVAITGFDGGHLAQVADLSVHVPTAIGDYGVAEDLHLMIGHIVKEVLIAGEKRGS